MTPTTGEPTAQNVHLLLTARRPDLALPVAIDLANLDPTGEHLALLSHCAAAAGDASLAERAARDAVATAPDLDDAHRALAYATFAKGTAHQRRLAIGHARRAVEVGPAFAGNHRALTSLLLAARRPLLAAQAARKVVALAPVDPASWMLAADIALHLGQVRAAERSVAHALALDASDPGALSTMGYLRARRGDLAGAHELHRSAIGEDPADEDLIRLAGRSANRRTAFLPVAVIGAIVAGAVLSGIGLFLGPLASVSILNAIDRGRVERGRHPLGLPRSQRDQPGIGDAIVAYRSAWLKRQQVGPTIGWSIITYAVAALALLALGGLLLVAAPTDGGRIVGQALVLAGVGIAALGFARRHLARAITAPR